MAQLADRTLDKEELDEIVGSRWNDTTPLPRPRLSVTSRTLRRLELKYGVLAAKGFYALSRRRIHTAIRRAFEAGSLPDPGADHRERFSTKGTP